MGLIGEREMVKVSKLQLRKTHRLYSIGPSLGIEPMLHADLLFYDCSHQLPPYISTGIAQALVGFHGRTYIFYEFFSIVPCRNFNLCRIVLDTKTH